MSEIGKQKLVKPFSKINFYWTEKLPANFRHYILLGYILPKKGKALSISDNRISVKRSFRLTQKTSVQRHSRVSSMQKSHWGNINRPQIR